MRAVVLVALLVSCTKPNPRSCLDGTCTDPAFPFCDVEGEVDGQADTCIAVDCTPGEFRACRGDFAITCNTEGTDFTVLQCERGCDAATGCHLCDPNETACTNGTVATCDGSGAVVASEPCPLGCFESEPRCREVDPSNGLATLLDMTSDAPDLDLNGHFILTDAGMVLDQNFSPVPVTSVLLPASAGGSPIRVIVAGAVHISGVVSVGVQVTTSANGPALAILAHDDIVIDGALTFWSDDPRVATTAGGVDIAGCSGGLGQQKTHQNPTQDINSGGGGGGHATAGAAGSSIDTQLNGGTGGGASGNATLVPLRGGCPGGGLGGPGPSGGGAVQLVSRTAIRFADGATIDANGFTGVVSDGGPSPIFGGGGGGGILLEAPIVQLGAGARLLVNGGPTIAADSALVPESLTTTPAEGGKCTGSPSLHCSDGGNGAALDGPATGDFIIPYTNSPTVTAFKAGGGGGGLGFIRINTATGAFDQSSDSIVSGSTSTAPLGTR